MRRAGSVVRMTRISMASVLREVLVAAGVAVVLVVVLHAGTSVIAPRQLRVILPFLGVALGIVPLSRGGPPVHRVVAGLAGHGGVSPYSALAEAARRIQAG